MAYHLRCLAYDVWCFMYDVLRMMYDVDNGDGDDVIMRRCDV